MLEKITITGEYIGNDTNGIIIGGKHFYPGIVLTADVDEDVFLNLQLAEKNGWFKIISHNYQEFLKSRDRLEQPVIVEAVTNDEINIVVEEKKEANVTEDATVNNESEVISQITTTTKSRTRKKNNNEMMTNDIVGE